MWFCIPTTSSPMPSTNSQSHTGVTHPIKQIQLSQAETDLWAGPTSISVCSSPSMTAETPSNVHNQLWETVPTANPAEILRRRIFYRKGIMKCQMRKEIHKLITGRNNFDLSHGSSFQLKLLFLLFMESLTVVLKIKPVLVLENLRFSVCSLNTNIYLLCCAVREYWT